VQLRDHRDVCTGVVGGDRGAHTRAAGTNHENVVLSDHIR
jgi:hypothetical protein